MNTFKGAGQSVIVDQKTGAYWINSRYRRTLYAPDGSQAATELRWGRILSTLHGDGWLGGAMGSWLADIAAGAMMVFGASGLVLFVNPRLRRRKNRLARQAHADRSGTQHPGR